MTLYIVILFSSAHNNMEDIYLQDVLKEKKYFVDY